MKRVLYYVIPKMANYRNSNDDCAIAIVYKPTEDEKDLPDYSLINHKRKWVSTQLSLPELFVIPSSKEEFDKMNGKVENVPENI